MWKSHLELEGSPFVSVYILHLYVLCIHTQTPHPLLPRSAYKDWSSWLLFQSSDAALKSQELVRRVMVTHRRERAWEDCFRRARRREALQLLPHYSGWTVLTARWSRNKCSCGLCPCCVKSGGGPGAGGSHCPRGKWRSRGGWQGMPGWSSKRSPSAGGCWVERLPCQKEKGKSLREESLLARWLQVVISPASRILCCSWHALLRHSHGIPSALCLTSQKCLLVPCGDCPWPSSWESSLLLSPDRSVVRLVDACLAG